ncbi:MAG: thioredoxin domain-containing protein, partial [Bowdeniella nasicola]|nr:thioredoxin domain-containing protein [Bowdeniella nasicola]
LVVVIAGWWIISKGKTEAGQAPQPVDSHIDAPGAITIGASGKPGSVNEGKPVVDTYFDFTCPHCYVFEQNYVPALEKAAVNGEITLVMHGVAILDPTDDHSGFSSLAADAYHEVAMRDPDHFAGLGVRLFELTHALMEGSQPVTGNGLDQIVQALKEHGVAEDVITDIAAGNNEKIAEKSVDAFVEAGLKGTPALMVNGVDLPIESWGDDGDDLIKAIRDQVK